jgi:ParB-like chromosome segregation protein Spo0J
MEREGQAYQVRDPEALELHPEFSRLFEMPGEDEVAGLAARMAAGERFPPLLVDPRGRVLAGAAHWLAARRLGWREISAVQAPEMGRARLRALLVAENVRSREVREEHLGRAMNNFFDMQPLRPPGGW